MDSLSTKFNVALQCASAVHDVMCMYRLCVRPPLECIECHTLMQYTCRFHECVSSPLWSHNKHCNPCFTIVNSCRVIVLKYLLLIFSSSTYNPCVINGTEQIMNLGWQVGWLWYDVLALVIFSILFLSLAYVILRCIKKEK